MTTRFALSLLTLVFVFSLQSRTSADVVLIFDQSGGTGNGQQLDQDYGDRVTASPDGNGHQYDIITGAGLGLTPNVEMSYGPGIPRLWILGYGDLTNVYYEEDMNDGALEMTFDADPGYEVGLFGFDVAAFLSDRTIAGLSVVDGNNNVLWSQGSTLISGTSHNDFDFVNGLFAESLTLSIDLSGLGSDYNDIGIDNVHFAQRAIPEPGSGLLLLGVGVAVFSRRRSGRRV